MPDLNQRTISMSEAARLAGVSLSTISRAAHRGELPTVRVGKVLRVDTAAFLALLAVKS